MELLQVDGHPFWVFQNQSLMHLQAMRAQSLWPVCGISHSSLDLILLPNTSTRLDCQTANAFSIHAAVIELL
jgi:hypothetical protein